MSPLTPRCLQQTHLLLCSIEEVRGWVCCAHALLYILHTGPVQVHRLLGVRVDVKVVDPLGSWLVLQMGGAGVW